MILLYTGMYVIVFYSREKKCLRCCGCVELLLQCCCCSHCCCCYRRRRSLIRPFCRFHGQPNSLKLFLQAPVLVHGHQNIAPSQKFPADEDLRNRRPVGKRFDSVP